MVKEQRQKLGFTKERGKRNEKKNLQFGNNCFGLQFLDMSA